jgi:hypothetical protein
VVSSALVHFERGDKNNSSLQYMDEPKLLETLPNEADDAALRSKPGVKCEQTKM